MAHDIYVSYSEEDRPAAEAIVRALEAQDLRCWIPDRDIVAGARPNSAAADAIETAQLILLIWSSSAKASRRLEREIAFASSVKRVILPVMIEDVDFSDGFRFLVDGRHLDASDGPLERQMEEIVAAVTELLERLGPVKLRAPYSSQRPKQAALLRLSIAWVVFEYVFHHIDWYATSSPLDQQGLLLVGALIGGIGGCVVVALMVVFAMWTYDSYRNLKAFGPGGLFSAGLATGSFFIPVVGVFLPPFVFNEMWKKSAAGEKRLFHPLFLIWPFTRAWVIAAWLGAWYNFLFVTPGKNYEPYDIHADLLSLANGLDVLVTYLAVAVITKQQDATERGIVERETRRFGVQQKAEAVKGA